MVAILDTDARREAQILIDQYGDLALVCAADRAQDAAARGNALLVGLWEIVGCNIRSMLPALRAAETSSRPKRPLSLAQKISDSVDAVTSSSCHTVLRMTGGFHEPSRMPCLPQ